MTSKTLAALIASGFNRSVRTGTKRYQVRCDSCEASVINGVACHERGCPNAQRSDDDDE